MKLGSWQNQVDVWLPLSQMLHPERQEVQKDHVLAQSHWSNSSSYVPQIVPAKTLDVKHQCWLNSGAYSGG